MTVAEYVSWQNFYQSEPFGDIRADLRSGIVASLIARTMGGKRGAKPMDYMPLVDALQKDDERNQSQRERNAQIRQAFEANLGTRVRRVKIRRSSLKG